MLVEYLGGKRNRFLCGDRAVRLDMQRELVIIRDVADTRVFHGVLCLIHGRVDRIGEDQTDRRAGRNGCVVRLLILLLRNIAM